MTKHRTITGFVVVALLAVAATAAAMRAHYPSKNHSIEPVGIMSFAELAGSVNKLATDDYDDQSRVYSAKRN